MKQEAPDPKELFDLVATLQYKDWWKFTLEDLDRGQGSVGLTLCILITTPDSYHPESMRRVMHYFIVPAAAYDMRSWRRWLFDQILLVETHEAAEFFVIKGEHVYAPRHGPGNDPYTVVEYADELDRRTNYKGEINSL